MKAKILLLTLAGVAMSVPAIAADTKYTTQTNVERNDDGSYKKSIAVEHDSAAGVVKSKTTTELDVDKDGDSKKTVTTEDIDDPKGLLNKQVTKVKDTVEVNDGEVVKKATKTVNGHTVVDQEVKTTR